MIDPFGRSISYLRVSVTDRCDYRCSYCMAEDTIFLPRDEVLSLEELGTICDHFIALGVRRLRITGGEPLVRRNVMQLISRLGAQLRPSGGPHGPPQGSAGLDELTLTTNGSQLARHADALAAAGVRRINVSLDSLRPDRFAAITRRGHLAPVLAGIAAAKSAGLAIKINTVALRGINDDEFDDLLAWCGSQGFDLCLIETMPMGEIDADRTDQYLPLSEVRTHLRRRWTLTPSPYVTGGPARYWNVVETGQRIGFITPMTHNFCESCNRVRLTCTGQLFLCLGQQDQADLRSVLRTNGNLDAAIRAAIERKPRGHDFIIDRPAVPRTMSMTGG